jgi:hypothetical protein
MDHLLLHCSVVCEIWSFVFQLFGIDWVISKCVGSIGWLEELVWKTLLGGL